MQHRSKRFAAAAAVLAPLVLAAAAWAAEELIVTAREAAIRREPKSYSPRVGAAKEGAVVTVIRRQAPWILVKVGGVEGWVNESATTADEKTVLSPAAQTTTVAASDRSAAGRGFTPEVEREHRQDHPDLAEEYAAVDRISAAQLSDEEIRAFREAGRLVVPGEAP